MFIAECILESQHMALLNFSCLWKDLYVWVWKLTSCNKIFLKSCCLEAHLKCFEGIQEYEIVHVFRNRLIIVLPKVVDLPI